MAFGFLAQAVVRVATIFGGKPPTLPPPPPPPEPTFMETLFSTAGAYPTLTTVVLTWFGIYLLLSLKAAAASKKPGSPPKLPASDYVVYRKGERVTCTDPKGEAVVRVAKTGIASLEPETLSNLFKLAAASFPSAPAMKAERPKGTWVTWTWAEYFKGSSEVAKSLIQLGFAAHDCVNIIGFNSPEWFMAQMGAILAGGKAAGVYTTNEPSSCQYVAEHSEAKVVFVEDAKQTAKYLSFKDKLPNLKMLVQWSGAPPEGVSGRVPVEAWGSFVSRSMSVADLSLQERAAAQKPGHCATLIYTSGTTGNPKAVMISHDNMIFEAVCSIDQLFSGAADGAPPPKEMRIVSYLPLSHVAGQMLDIATPLVVTACGGPKGYGPAKFHGSHYTTWFADNMALKGSLPATLVAARPTAFLGVPRVWEKIRERLLEVGKGTKGLKKLLSTWAKRHAASACAARQLGRSGRVSASYMVSRAILGAVKKKLGLDAAVACLTAAAPMPTEVAAYFGSLDIDLLDLYGMSECTGATTLSTGRVHLAGAVGAPLGPAELRIDHVAGRDNPTEGEICYRGRHIMMGYMKDVKKTAEAIDVDGWLHSGDVGLLDDDGLLHITGRIKELIITAGGENIAPVPIEDKLKELCPAISNAMMVGDKRKYNVILLTLKTEVHPETGTSTGKLAAAAAAVSDAATDEAAIAESKVKGSKWQMYLQSNIDLLNSKHSVSNAQRIQKFALLPGDFSEKGGELTATLKLKRGPTAEKYAAVIDAMY